MRLSRQLLIGALAFFVATNGFAEQIPSAQEIRIGFVAPVSGPYQALGQRLVNGATLAAEEHFEKSGTRIRLITEDSQFDAKHSVSAFRKLTESDKIDAIVVVDSIAIDAIVPLARRAGLPTVVLAQPGMESEIDNVFQLAEEYSLCGETLAATLNAEKPKNVAVLVEAIRAYERLYDLFAATAQFPVQRFATDPDGSTMPTIAVQVSAQKPSHIVLMMGAAQSGRFVKHYRIQQRHETPMLFEESLLMGLDAFRELVGNTAIVDGDRIGVIIRSSEPAFVEKYRKRFSDDPGFAEYSYDGIGVLTTTYSPDRSHWIKQIQNIDYAGASGRTTFDAQGVRHGEAKVLQIRDVREARGL